MDRGCPILTAVGPEAEDRDPGILDPVLKPQRRHAGATPPRFPGAEKAHQRTGREGWIRPKYRTTMTAPERKDRAHKRE